MVRARQESSSGGGSRSVRDTAETTDRIPSRWCTSLRQRESSRWPSPALALAVRYVPITNRVLLGVAALAPYLMLGAPVSLIVFALRRDWILAAAAAAAAVTIATVAVQLPWYVRSGAVPGVGVRLMSANLRYGRADADTVVSLAREHADILAVQ